MRNLRKTLFLSVLALAGCVKPADPPKPVPPPTAADVHAHKPAAHGGLIVEVGRDSYHAEAVFAANGVLHLYTLGSDEAKVQEVEVQELAAYARPADGGESTHFTLKSDPQPGDAAGKTSRFTGVLPNELWGKPVEVTIPAVRFGTERFRIGFRSPEKHAAMPAKASDAEERTLYLTPGGKYTAADIAANGSAVASARFKGVPAAHDLKPQPGDPICPVTLTKANPTFAWVVGGEKYLFCCPPCVDEFVKLAKDNPAEVKPAAAYQKGATP